MKIYTDSVKLLRTFFIEIILILLLIYAIFFSAEFSNADVKAKIIIFSSVLIIIILLSYMIHMLLGIIEAAYEGSAMLLNDHSIKKSTGVQILISILAGFFIAIVGAVVEMSSVFVVLGSQRPEVVGLPFKFYIIEEETIIVINLLMNIGIFGLTVFIYSKFHPPNSSS